MIKQDSVFRIPLVRELAIITLIKIVVIFAIGRLFFSATVEVDPQGQAVQNYFISSSSDYSEIGEDL